MVERFTELTKLEAQEKFLRLLAPFGASFHVIFEEDEKLFRIDETRVSLEPARVPSGIVSFFNTLLMSEEDRKVLVDSPQNHSSQSRATQAPHH